MKKIVFRYSIYAAIAIVVFGMLNLLLVKRASYTVQEIAGYLSILVSMIFVFLGIRQYRDKVNGGYLTFGQGMKVGILIVLIPAVFFGLFDILYTQVIDPSWGENYYNHFIEEAKRTTAPDKLAAKLKEIEDQREFWSNPVMQFLLMAATVFIVGTIVAIISSITLSKKKPAFA
jgi:hypothetical protein